MAHDTAADAQQILLSFKDRVPWALEFHEELVESPAAKKAFEQLIAAGCDPGDLLFWLNFCCRDYAIKHATDKRGIAEEFALFGKQLLNNAKRLQRAEASQAKREILKTLQLPEFQGLSERLKAYAESLTNEAAELKPMSVRRVPGLLTGWLAARVEGSTGGTHYSEIAKLMEAHYRMRGIHRDISSPAVAKQVKRFRQKSPMAYSHMRNIASRELGRYKEKTFLERFPTLAQPKLGEK